MQPQIRALASAFSGSQACCQYFQCSSRTQWVFSFTSLFSLRSLFMPSFDISIYQWPRYIKRKDGLAQNFWCNFVMLSRQSRHNLGTKMIRTKWNILLFKKEEQQKRIFSVVTTIVLSSSCKRTVSVYQEKGCCLELGWDCFFKMFCVS